MGNFGGAALSTGRRSVASNALAWRWYIQRMPIARAWSLLSAVALAACGSGTEPVPINTGGSGPTGTTSSTGNGAGGVGGGSGGSSGNSDSVNALAAGKQYVCAVRDSGTVWCWGEGSAGQLGDGEGSDSAVPVQVSGLTGVVEVAAGELHACARTSAGVVSCWGEGAEGQLGDGELSGSDVPVEVDGLVADALGLGDLHSCAVLEDDTVNCWGSNTFEQLGNAGAPDDGTPVTVLVLSEAEQVDGGREHGCALLTHGTIWCWGFNSSGQLGNGGTNEADVPVQVDTVTDGVALALGDYHACAITADDKVMCWGNNEQGQSGQVTSVDLAKTPLPVQEFGTTLGAPGAIAAGSQHTCASLSDEGIVCWGEGESGQLGSGRLVASNTPEPVSGLSEQKIVAVAAGGRFSCAALENGNVTCWGKGDAGQLGNGASEDSDVPVTVTF